MSKRGTPPELRALAVVIVGFVLIAFLARILLQHDIFTPVIAPAVHNTFEK